MTDVREMTRREPTFARSVINCSVMPSAKYSWDGSPNRLASGRTAMERIEAGVLVGCETARTFQRAETTATKRIATAKTAGTLARVWVLLIGEAPRWPVLLMLGVSAK